MTSSRTPAFPQRATRFIGRVAAVEQLGAALADHRLVTVTGSAGCGKTRLALEVARRLEPSFADGGVFVDLAPVAKPLVANAFAAAAGVTEDGAAPVAELLWRALEDRAALVLVDNCEGIVEPCATIVDGLLTRCPRVTVLATSREPLGVEGELTWRIPSLSLPAADHVDPRAALEDSEAGSLLLDRAALARPDLDWNAERAAAGVTICRRLDGVPLAVELACSRLRALEPADVARGLDDRFAMLRSGPRAAPPRQRTLEASITWSYELLDDESRTLLRRLSVFAASFTVDNAVAVTADAALPAAEIPALLADLVDRSLVQRDDLGFRLLESIREYASVRLVDRGEDGTVRLRHLARFGAIAGAFDAIAEQAELGDAVPEVRLTLPDVRAAQAWSLTAGRVDEGLRLAADLRLFWITDARNQEGRDWLRALLDAGGEVRLSTRLAGLLAAAQLALFALDPVRQAELAAEGLAIARDVGDRQQEVRALTLLGWARIFFAPEQAGELLADAITLAEEVDDPVRVEFASFGAGAAAVLRGDLSGAAAHLERGLVLSQRRDTFGQMFGLGMLGYVRCLQGSLDAAAALLAEACAYDRGDDRGFNRDLAQQWLALVLTFQGRFDEADRELRTTIARAAEVGNPPMFALVSAAWLAHARGDAEAVVALVDEALPQLELVGLTFFEVQALRLLGDAESTRGADPDPHWRRAMELADASANPISRTIALIGLSRSATVDAQRRRSMLRDAVRTSLAADFRLGLIDAVEELAVAAAEHLGDADSRRILAAVAAEREKIGYVRFADAPRLAERSSADGAGPDAVDLDEAAALACRGDRRPARPPSGWASLTPAELRVVKLVAAGLTNPQIGQQLFISRPTVKTHISNAFTKLGISTRAELAAEYIRRGDA